MAHEGRLGSERWEAMPAWEGADPLLRLVAEVCGGGNSAAFLSSSPKGHRYCVLYLREPLC